MSSLRPTAPDPARSYVPSILVFPVSHGCITYPVDFADLAIIDLSKARTPDGRAELAPQLFDALRTNGFLYAINHGYTQAQVSITTIHLSRISPPISAIGFST